jgi:hypothetical protein
VNWTFTVSDKRNIAPAFAFTTATTCLAYRLLPKTPCRSTFPDNLRPSRSLPFFIPLSYQSNKRPSSFRVVAKSSADHAMAPEILRT